MAGLLVVVAVAASLTALAVTFVKALRNDARASGQGPPLRLSELCEHEARQFDAYASQCRDHAARNVPEDSDRSGDRPLRLLYWVGDAPTSQTWMARAEYFERCAERCRRAARRHARVED